VNPVFGRKALDDQSPADAPRKGPARELGLPLLGILVVGAATGLLWPPSANLAAKLSEPAEGAAAQQLVFALLGVIAGVVTAVVILRRPGRRLQLRVAVLLPGSLLASGLGYLIGHLAGAPWGAAPATILVWPVVASALVVLRLLVSVAPAS
jgi:hypothetical protein